MLDVSAKRLEKFSYKALDISALRAKGNKVLSLKEHNLADILHVVTGELSEVAEKKNISFNLECFQDVITVMVDQKKIRNTICYVVENAIHFSEPGSTVTITTKTEEGKAVCSIKDQGAGFSDYALQQLFKPFSNVKQHVDANVGLSLYYAKLVMDAHGGSISVEKNRPKGSVINISFF
ncbi:MAG: HAMP domain-containing histidine kinase [Bacteroidia bacterium]|nr:HAMP domain-containing histidine kinase [Bacteroidia bacterium]